MKTANEIAGSIVTSFEGKTVSHDNGTSNWLISHIEGAIIEAIEQAQRETREATLKKVLDFLKNVDTGTLTYAGYDDAVQSLTDAINGDILGVDLKEESGE